MQVGSVHPILCKRGLDASLEIQGRSGKGGVALRWPSGTSTVSGISVQGKARFWGWVEGSHRLSGCLVSPREVGDRMSVGVLGGVVARCQESLCGVPEIALGLRMSLWSLLRLTGLGGVVPSRSPQYVAGSVNNSLGSGLLAGNN